MRVCRGTRCLARSSGTERQLLEQGRGRGEAGGRWERARPRFPPKSVRQHLCCGVRIHGRHSAGGACTVAPAPLTAQGPRCQLPPTLGLSACLLPAEHPRVGLAGVYMPPVLLREAFCPGKLPHHQRLPPEEGQQPHLLHLFSECRAGGAASRPHAAVAAVAGSEVPWGPQGWSQTVPPFMTLLFMTL